MLHLAHHLAGPLALLAAGSLSGCLRPSPVPGTPPPEVSDEPVIHAPPEPPPPPCPALRSPPFSPPSLAASCPQSSPLFETPKLLIALFVDQQGAVSSTDGQAFFRWSPDCRKKIARMTIGAPTGGPYLSDPPAGLGWMTAEGGLAVMTLATLATRRVRLPERSFRSMSVGGGKAVVNLQLPSPQGCPPGPCERVHECTVDGCAEVGRGEAWAISPDGAYRVAWHGSTVRVWSAEGEKASYDLGAPITQAAVDDTGVVLACGQHERASGKAVMVRCAYAKLLANPWRPGLFTSDYDGSVWSVACENGSFGAKRHRAQPGEMTWAAAETVLSYSVERYGVTPTVIPFDTHAPPATPPLGALP